MTVMRPRGSVRGNTGRSGRHRLASCARPREIQLAGSIARWHQRQVGSVMSLSVFEIFKIGIGPSSSHTMGPMNAARAFVDSLATQGLLPRTTVVTAELFGSLALTGRGHCTDRAILLGLEGMRPETIDSAQVEPTVERIRQAKQLRLRGEQEIVFDEPRHLLFHHNQVLPGHSNGMRFTARDAVGARRWPARNTTALAAASSSRRASRRATGRSTRRRRTRSTRRPNCWSLARSTGWKFTS